MRNLNNMDLFKIMRIIRKAEIKDKIVNLKLPRDKDGNITMDQEEYGVMLMLEFVDGAPEAEDEIFEFLASIGEVKPQELKEDEFDLLMQIIKHLTEQKNFMSFLKQAFKSAS